MRNRWGVEIKRGFYAWASWGRDGTKRIEGTIVSIDKTSDYAKAYGPGVKLKTSDGEYIVGLDAISQVLPPMSLQRGGVVKANPTPNLERYDQPSQREHINAKTGKATKRASPRLKARRVKTHYAKTPGVWANPLVRVKVKSPAQRGKAAPSPRLVARRKTTQKAPEGFYANPAGYVDNYQFRVQVKSGKAWKTLAGFPRVADARTYARAYHAAHPTCSVRVTD